MKISAEMLAEGLSKSFTINVVGPLSMLPTIGSLLLVGPDTVWQDGKTYLVESPGVDQVPATHIDSVVLIVGAFPEVLPGRFQSALIFDEETTLFEVHNRIQDIFAEYNMWEAEIHRMLSGGSDVQSMLDISAGHFGNPLILFDSNYKVIASSKGYSADERMAPVFDCLRLPFLMRSNQDDAYRGGHRGSNQAGHARALYINDMRAYSVSYMQQAFTYQLVLVELDKGLSASDVFLLEHLAEFVYLAIGFVPGYIQAESGLQSTLKLCVSGELTSTTSITKRLARYGWLPTHQYVCLKFAFEIHEQRNRTLRFKEERFTETLGEHSVFEHGDSIVAFVNLDLHDGGDNGFEGILMSYLQDNLAKAGMSNRFTGFEDLDLYYRQAELALSYGQRLNPYLDLFRFAGIVKPHLLACCTNKLPAHMVCSPGLIALQRHDAEHGTCLYRTLQVFIKCRFSYANSAKELFIHRSTFMHRLQRIKKVSGIDVMNTDELWHILLSFELLEYELP
ncbi:MAG: helix-turn-helix domain-containing protein [Coriobacteriales bacterium]|jgi:hypothetical protein|nr:helix-turn-helix domain-containing protein [Coriobacteriales bacterium]